MCASEVVAAATAAVTSFWRASPRLLLLRPTLLPAQRGLDKGLVSLPRCVAALLMQRAS